MFRKNLAGNTHARRRSRSRTRAHMYLQLHALQHSIVRACPDRAGRAHASTESSMDNNRRAIDRGERDRGADCRGEPTHVEAHGRRRAAHGDTRHRARAHMGGCWCRGFRRPLVRTTKNRTHFWVFFSGAAALVWSGRVRARHLRDAGGRTEKWRASGVAVESAFFFSLLRVCGCRTAAE